MLRYLSGYPLSFIFALLLCYLIKYQSSALFIDVHLGFFR